MEKPISVNCRLPEVDEYGHADVMFYLLIDEGYMEWRIGHFNNQGGGFPGVWFTHDRLFNENNCPLKPTHWLPLPGPPEENNEQN